MGGADAAPADGAHEVTFSQAPSLGAVLAALRGPVCLGPGWTSGGKRSFHLLVGARLAEIARLKR